jgi:uncharacterized protein YutE (UPF0331/DUF86 family)
VSPLDRETLAEKVAAIDRHLARVAARVPTDAARMQPATDATDAVVLHLWQAVQLVIDLALALCVDLRLGAPGSYADAFRLLAQAGHLDTPLAERLARAAGFRNAVAHAYEQLDLQLVHRAATEGVADLRAFVARAIALVR